MRALKVAAAIAMAVGLAGCQLMQGDAGVALDPDDIGGVVTGAAGPEAGVWVIAETDELPTRFAKIVVTDARGRYLLPDLPPASYNVWVRGYGLVDSPRVKASPGKLLNLKAVPAPTPKAAAEYYPAMYWFSMLRVPPANEFPLGPVPSQGAWLNIVKTGACGSCHAPPKVLRLKRNSIRILRAFIGYPLLKLLRQKRRHGLIRMEHQDPRAACNAPRGERRRFLAAEVDPIEHINPVVFRRDGKHNFVREVTHRVDCAPRETDIGPLVAQHQHR